MYVKRYADKSITIYVGYRNGMTKNLCVAKQREMKLCR